MKNWNGYCDDSDSEYDEPYVELAETWLNRAVSRTDMAMVAPVFVGSREGVMIFRFKKIPYYSGDVDRETWAKVSHNTLNKRLCSWAFTPGRTCTRERCHMAHHIMGLDPFVIDDIWKTAQCKNFDPASMDPNGGCPYGARCRFAHTITQDTIFNFDFTAEEICCLFDFLYTPPASNAWTVARRAVVAARRNALLRHAEAQAAAFQYGNPRTVVTRATIPPPPWQATATWADIVAKGRDSQEQRRNHWKVLSH